MIWILLVLSVVKFYVRSVLIAENCYPAALSSFNLQYSVMEFRFLGTYFSVF